MNAEDTSYSTDNSSSCYAEYRRKKKPITERQAPWDCTYKSYPDRAVKATETERRMLGAGEEGEMKKFLRLTVPANEGYM